MRRFVAGAKAYSVLPGFGLSMGITFFYVGLLVVLPLSMLFFKISGMSWSQFEAAVVSQRLVAAYGLSFGAALLAAAMNAVFGLVTAWVLVRYSFPGRRLLDGLVDLPFALPTAVAGITLTSLYAPNGWIGQGLLAYGVKVAYTPAGIVLALIFVCMPFVVRMVQPVLRGLDREVEEAAASLGAGRWQIFWQIIFPELLPALLTGFALAFARGLGEYGSVVFISGNMPLQTEIAPLLIMTKLEQYDYVGASAIAVVLLLASFLLLLTINALQWWSRRRGEK